MKLNYYLDRVENTHEITVESDPAFWQLVQQGILLSLKESDLITEAQLRQSEEHLVHQSEQH